MEGRITVHEEWADDDALQAHLEHPNYFAMRDLPADLGISAMECAKHEVALSAPVYRPDFVPDAHWWG